MFTGIIEEIGKVKSIRKDGAALRIEVGATKVLDQVITGGSIAVNGVCLTATGFTKDSFYAHVIPETVRNSIFSSLAVGNPVNLERALSATGRFDGHMVAGHVDGIGTVEGIRKDSTAIVFHITVSPAVHKYIVYKGSVAVNGISLTVSAVGDYYFEVSIIPHSLQETTLLYVRTGDKVNIETDIIGRYVEKLLSLQLK